MWKHWCRSILSLSWKRRDGQTEKLQQNIIFPEIRSENTGSSILKVKRKQYLESEKELIDRDSDHDTREIVKSFWTGQNMLLPARAISNTTSRWIRRSERSLKMKKERPFCWDIIVLAQWNIHAVNKKKWIALFQRAAAPFFKFRDNFISYVWNHFMRYWKSINVFDR